jgi:hypothetical protein
MHLWRTPGDTALAFSLIDTKFRSEFACPRGSYASANPAQKDVIPLGNFNLKGVRTRGNVCKGCQGYV